RLYSWLRQDGSEEAALSYGELRERACALAVCLRLRWDVPERGRVMLVYPPGLEFLVAFFGAQYAAVIAVPYYPPVLPTSPAPSASARRRLADGLAKLARIAGAAAPLVCREEACRWPEEWRWHASDDSLAPPSGEEEAWLHAAVAGRTRPAESEIAFLQFTSGSTGNPKGVMVGTRNLVANVRLIIQANVRAVPAGELAIVSWLPQYHDMGLIGGCLSAALSGWRAELLSPFAFLQRPLLWLLAISRLSDSHHVVSPAPNFGYALCVRRDAELPRLDLSRWRIAMNGAEPIRAATLREFEAKFGRAGFDPASWACVFGLAENVLYVAGCAEPAHLLRLDRARLAVGDVPLPRASPAGASQALEACGHALLPERESGQAVRIVGDAREALPDGTVGEVWVRGPSVARGYWQLEELSRETFCATLAGSSEGQSGESGCGADSYLRTGDLGLLWEGRLYIVGRIKDVLTIKGRTLHAHDIEVCAERGSDALRLGCCAAFPVLGDDGDEALVLMAELREEAARACAAVAAQVASAVGEGEGVRPTVVVLLAPRSILKTTSGKLRRRELRLAY
ncbi:hypothetical protein EMIHUDRAFT_41407, partial [Emiliania huxleyi CCMP1516]|uniref:AMP-dependent synthetase/ligase domain-containing protein n=2 Tax=Emiliania huxleyi TaxID=2903 RepID=A0A0D3I571_EMIH1